MSYLDTIGILMAERPLNQQFQAIERMSGSHTCRRAKAGGGWKLRIHQPQKRLLALLEQWGEQRRWTWNEVHIVIEIPCATAIDAEKCHEWLQRHHVQPYRHAGYLGTSDQRVSYTTRKPWGKTAFASYADHPSKITGEPCCRWELRAKKACRVQRLMEQLSIERVGQFANIDHRELWRKQLGLWEVDLLALGRQIRKRKRQKRSEHRYVGRIKIDLDRRAGAWAVMYAMARLRAKRHVPVAGSAQAVRHLNELLHRDRKVDPRCALHPIDNTKFLPKPEGCPMVMGEML